MPISLGMDYTDPGWHKEQIAIALAAGLRGVPCPPSAKEYEGMRLSACTLEFLELCGIAGKLNLRDKAQIISTALQLHTTSDFPIILGSVFNKILMPAYENANSTYRSIAAVREFPDFRPTRFIRTGDFPLPLQVNEHAEYKYGSMTENEELVSLVTYGRIIGFTRQAFINDDLGALRDAASAAGQRLADFENATFFATCLTAGSGLGPTMKDTNTVFCSAHKNVTAAGALTNSLLGSARSLLKQQVSLDGIKLNLDARILLVSPDSQTLAETLLTVIMAPTSASVVNPFAGKVIPLSDANLSGGTRFYFLADPARLPNFVYGYLAGDKPGPRVDSRLGFNVDGVELKVSLDFGCGAIDYRGGISGAGA